MSRAAILLALGSSWFFGRALGQDGGCSSLSADARVVSTPQEASALTTDLRECPGLEFNVFWVGSTVLLEPMQLSNSTVLRITSLEASVLDGGQQQLFLVSGESVLVIEGMGLTGGQSESGAVVAASGGASVTFVDCDVYGNRASENGGVCTSTRVGHVDCCCCCVVIPEQTKIFRKYHSCVCMFRRWRDCACRKLYNMQRNGCV